MLLSLLSFSVVAVPAIFKFRFNVSVAALSFMSMLLLGLLMVLEAGNPNHVLVNIRHIDNEANIVDVVASVSKVCVIELVFLSYCN